MGIWPESQAFSEPTSTHFDTIRQCIMFIQTLNPKPKAKCQTSNLTLMEHNTVSKRTSMKKAKASTWVLVPCDLCMGEPSLCFTCSWQPTLFPIWQGFSAQSFNFQHCKRGLLPLVDNTSHPWTRQLKSAIIMSRSFWFSTQLQYWQEKSLDPVSQSWQAEWVQQGCQKSWIKRNADFKQQMGKIKAEEDTHICLWAKRMQQSYKPCTK